jgi:hypothetical protein
VVIVPEIHIPQRRPAEGIKSTLPKPGPPGG